MEAGRTQLAQWIDRRGWNQRETARELGMDPATLNHILTGRRSVGLAIAVQIERKTGIPVEAWMRICDGESAQAASVAARKHR